MELDTLDKCIATLFECKQILENEVELLCDKCCELLVKESNVVEINPSVTVCGNICGQLPDLLELFKNGGNPPYTSYLFLGSYVNRGDFSVETMSLLVALKVRYPDRITLLRGSHEGRQITQIYGLYDECLRKYGSSNVWQYFTDLFEYLPLSAVIGGRIFCVHGGLSPSIDSLEEIMELHRIQETPHEGPLSDMLWSDPDDRNGWGIGAAGPGYQYGEDIVREFNQRNNLQLIIRSHQMVIDGFQWMSPEKHLVTIFSAPNYVYRCGNLGAFAEVDESMELNLRTFTHSPNQRASKKI
jgi:serine/threonine-protein phosphatase 2A catalytic subunit